MQPTVLTFDLFIHETIHAFARDDVEDSISLITTFAQSVGAQLAQSASVVTFPAALHLLGHSLWPTLFGHVPEVSDFFLEDRNFPLFRRHEEFPDLIAVFVVALVSAVMAAWKFPITVVVDRACAVPRLRLVFS